MQKIVPSLHDWALADAAIMDAAIIISPWGTSRNSRVRDIGLSVDKGFGALTAPELRTV